MDEVWRGVTCVFHDDGFGEVMPGGSMEKGPSDFEGPGIVVGGAAREHGVGEAGCCGQDEHFA